MLKLWWPDSQFRQPFVSNQGQPVLPVWQTVSANLKHSEYTIMQHAAFTLRTIGRQPNKGEKSSHRSISTATCNLLESAIATCGKAPKMTKDNMPRLLQSLRTVSSTVSNTSDSLFEQLSQFNIQEQTCLES